MSVKTERSSQNQSISTPMNPTLLFDGTRGSNRLPVQTWIHKQIYYKNIVSNEKRRHTAPAQVQSTNVRVSGLKVVKRMQLLRVFFFNLINRLHRNRYFFIALCCDSHSFQFLLGTTVTPREIEDIMVMQKFGVFWGILVGSRRY